MVKYISDSLSSVLAELINESSVELVLLPRIETFNLRDKIFTFKTRVSQCQCVGRNSHFYE